MLATCVQIGKLMFVMLFLSHFVLLSHVCHVFVTYLSLYMFYVRVMFALVNSPHLYVFSTHLYIVQLLHIVVQFLLYLSSSAAVSLVNKLLYHYCVHGLSGRS